MPRITNPAAVRPADTTGVADDAAGPDAPSSTSAPADGAIDAALHKHAARLSSTDIVDPHRRLGRRRGPVIEDEPARDRLPAHLVLQRVGDEHVLLGFGGGDDDDDDPAAAIASLLEHGLVDDDTAPLLRRLSQVYATAPQAVRSDLQHAFERVLGDLSSALLDVDLLGGWAEPTDAPADDPAEALFDPTP